MPNELARTSHGTVTAPAAGPILPAVIADAGEKASKRFIEFLTATIRNANTREAYGRAISDFLAWCERHRLTLTGIEPVHVAAYIEQLTKARSAPTVKQHLAAIRMCFDWLTSGGVMDFNPASSVRGPKHVVKQGKTPVLTADEAKDLLASIIPEKKNSDVTDGGEDDAQEEASPTIPQLRDRALITVMVFSFARVSAGLAMKVEDYYTEGRRAWFRLHEKDGKRHKVPAHHNAEKYVDAYLDAAGIAGQKKPPPLPPHRPAPPHDLPADAPHRRLADDQTPGPSRRPARRNLQPHLPGDRRYRLPRKRRYDRARPADRQPRIAKYHQAL